MCKLTFLFWWSHEIKNSTQFGAIFHLNINRTLFQKPVTSITLWPARCITSSPISEEKKPAVRLNLIIGSCNVVFTPPLFQCALQYLPLQLLTNKSENAWLLHINMEMHLFKEKRRETFHLINSKRWSYCFMILHWCITSASSKSTQEIHDINKISTVSPREQYD